MCVEGVPIERLTIVVDEVKALSDGVHTPERAVFVTAPRESARVAFMGLVSDDVGCVSTVPRTFQIPRHELSIVRLEYIRLCDELVRAVFRRFRRLRDVRLADFPPKKHRGKVIGLEHYLHGVIVEQSVFTFVLLPDRVEHPQPLIDVVIQHDRHLLIVSDALQVHVVRICLVFRVDPVLQIVSQLGQAFRLFDQYVLVLLMQAQRHGFVRTVALRLGRIDLPFFTGLNVATTTAAVPCVGFNDIY